VALIRSTIFEEFMMFFFCSGHQELAEKQKPPTHQGGGLNPPAEILFSEFPRRTSSEIFIPDHGHLSSSAARLPDSSPSHS